MNEIDIDDVCDVNEDLIGYEFTMRDGTTWRVLQTDVVLGSNYVAMRRLDEFGDLDERAEAFKVQNAGVIRRRKQIESAVAA